MKRRTTRGQTPQGDEPATTPVPTSSTDSPSTTTKATPGAPPSPAAVPQSTASKHANKGPKKTFLQKRRLSFIIGGLMGVFGAWFFTEVPLSSLGTLPDVDWDAFSSFDLQGLLADLPALSALDIPGLSTSKEWLNSKATNFEVGREAAARGQKKEHSVIIVPGIVSSGLESWSTSPESAPVFRKRLWASTSMLRAIVTSKDTWVAAMSLDPVTGIDPPGYKVRAAQGLDAASSFMPGYWLWKPIIENLAVLGYDHDDMQLFSYDWRLSYFNLEVRDRYFSRLKHQMEFNLEVTGKKTVLVAHSMGSLVVLWFFKWVEAEGHGGGGSDWVENHVAGFVSIAGTFLGVPKAMSALLSGEMRDTVEINAAGVYLLERLFSRAERAALFRSWAGASSMLMKGGNAVWGNGTHAPDDPVNATISGGNVYYFRPEGQANATEINSETTTPNMTMDQAIPHILSHAPLSYQTMVTSNFSVGMERSLEQLKLNDKDHKMWTNPLESRLPFAPSMSIYCIYGTGKPTERAYFYQNGGYEQGETGLPECSDAGCTNETARVPLDMPLSRRSWIDSTVSMSEEDEPKVRSGVIFGEGDGTVSLLSLGAMCVDGWKRDLYNPAQIPVITHEIRHLPLATDLRGGPTTADHVDILGNSESNEIILDVVSGCGSRVQQVIHSDIVEFASKIKWEED